jgi:PTH2 family peptidyl-tRNA hydrolase
MKKVTLKVDSLEELKKYISIAISEDLPTSLITDAGHTELNPGTTTCGAIGPGPEIKIDKITGDLKPL